MTDRKITGPCKDKIVIRTGGKIFSDGSILDLIRAPDCGITFAIWDGKCVKTASEFVRNGEHYVPLCIDPIIGRWLQLPRETADHGSTRELFIKISALISQVTQASKHVVDLLTYFVFSTWLSEPLPSAPFLWIVSPPTTPAGPLEQILTLLCRRALVVSERSLVEFHSHAVDLQATLITEVFAPTRRLLNLLRTSTQRGALTAVGGKFVDASSAIVVFALEPLRDSAIAGFPLELVLPATSKYIARISESEALQVVGEYQAQLLHYRLSNLRKVKTPTFDLGQFTVPIQEIACNLGASIVDDEDLQAQLVALLKPADDEIRVDYASLLTSIVLEVLLARCHTATGKYFPVTDICKDVNTVLGGRGDVTALSPERVGWILRALNLRTEFIPGGRKGLVVSNDVRKEIHDLAAAYGVRTLREVSEKIECQLCAALSLPWKMQATATGTSQANGGNL
jgi:hypothetical protein